MSHWRMKGIDDAVADSRGGLMINPEDLWPENEAQSAHAEGLVEQGMHASDIEQYFTFLILFFVVSFCAEIGGVDVTKA